MGESRDANDPRDQLRAMNKEARAEFERDERGDTGGVEHQSRVDREGIPAERRAVEAATREMTRTTREQDDSGALHVPRGEAATGGAEREAKPASADRDPRER